MNVSCKFLPKDADKNSIPVLFEVNISNSKDAYSNNVDIEEFALYPQEKEVTFLPYSCFVIDEKLEDFVGDALMVSTPVGSSAYNFNLGGPLIYDKIDSLILNSIAPINNCSYKSINNAVWFDKDNVITVKPNKEFVIHFIIDGFDMTLKDVDYIKISLSKKKLDVLRFKKVSYSELIHNKLL
jgi:NAD+ kinase